jgi:hypothetical protein
LVSWFLGLDRSLSCKLLEEERFCLRYGALSRYLWISANGMDWIGWAGWAGLIWGKWGRVCCSINSSKEKMRAAWFGCCGWQRRCRVTRERDKGGAARRQRGGQGGGWTRRIGHFELLVFLWWCLFGQRLSDSGFTCGLFEFRCFENWSSWLFMLI